MATQEALSRIQSMENSNLNEGSYRPDLLAKIKAASEVTLIDAREYEYRPDILSLTLYGSRRYWRILTKINNFRSFSDFTNFETLLIPSPATLQKYAK